MPYPLVDEIAVGWLRADPPLLALLGDPARIVGGEETSPPYPLVRVGSTPNADLRGLGWLRAPELLLEAWGDPDGSPGKSALWVIFDAALVALAGLPGRVAAPGEPVVASVQPSGGGGWAPVPVPGQRRGQPRWLAPLRVHLHPPFP